MITDADALLRFLNNCLPETGEEADQSTCGACPYMEQCQDYAQVSVPVQWIEDMRSYLKSQIPQPARLLTLEEVLAWAETPAEKRDPVFFEQKKGKDMVEIPVDLAKDVLALLKEQEPRLLTIEEITGDGECWFEGINGACGYADFYMCTGSKEVEINRISMRPEYVSWDDFKKKWRCWSARPTEEQRKATPWEPPKEG